MPVSWVGTYSPDQGAWLPPRRSTWNSSGESTSHQYVSSRISDPGSVVSGVFSCADIGVSLGESSPHRMGETNTLDGSLFVRKGLVR